MEENLSNATFPGEMRASLFVVVALSLAAFVQLFFSLRLTLSADGLYPNLRNWLVYPVQGLAQCPVHWSL